MTEVSPNGWNWSELYAGGMHVATYSQGTTYFDHSDWLGTVRQHSNMSGVGVERTPASPSATASTAPEA